MGPVDWLAVGLAALAGAACIHVWYDAVMPLREGQGRVGVLAVVLAMLVVATMMGHNFARVGAERLAEKPWLFWMMPVGFALWFVAPALVIAQGRLAVGWKERALDAAGWVLAFAVMGTVFWGRS